MKERVEQVLKEFAPQEVVDFCTVTLGQDGSILVFAGQRNNKIAPHTEILDLFRSRGFHAESRGSWISLSELRTQLTIRTSSGRDDEVYTTWFDCLSCGEGRIIRLYTAFCPCCGSRVKWEEKESAE